MYPLTDKRLGRFVAAGGTTTSSTVVSAACNATHMTTGSRLALPGGRAAWLATHTASQQREWPQSTSSRLPHRSAAEPSTSMGAAFKTHCQRWTAGLQRPRNQQSLQSRVAAGVIMFLRAPQPHDRDFPLPTAGNAVDWRNTRHNFAFMQMFHCVDPK